MSKKREFSMEQLKFIKEKLETLSKEKVREEYFKHFGESLSGWSLWKVMKANNWTPSDKHKKFTDEQILFICECMKTMSTRECCKEYEKYFEERLPQTTLRRLMDRYNIKPCKERKDRKPIGYEWYSEFYDSVMVKVAHPKGAKRGDYKFKHILIWEQTHGKPIPKGNVVMFLDGDRTNFDPDNLYCIPMFLAGQVYKNNMNSDDPIIQKASFMYQELRYHLLKYDPELVHKYDREESNIL